MDASKGESHTMNGDLPEDVMLQILSRLEVKELCKLRCVSKEWCKLILHPYFKVTP